MVANRHPDWLLKNHEGDYIRFHMAVWPTTCSTRLTRQYRPILTALPSVEKEWGFTYHKIDFTRAVAVDGAATMTLAVLRQRPSSSRCHSTG